MTLICLHRVYLFTSFLGYILSGQSWPWSIYIWSTIFTSYLGYILLGQLWPWSAYIRSTFFTSYLGYILSGQLWPRYSYIGTTFLHLIQDTSSQRNYDLDLPTSGLPFDIFIFSTNDKISITLRYYHLLWLLCIKWPKLVRLSFIYKMLRHNVINELYYNVPFLTVNGLCTASLNW